MTQRPNIIHILSDDQRADMWGGGDHPLIQTPHLDALARDGTNFMSARCTSALCTPSRASHYTGRWERAHGVNFNSPHALSELGWKHGWVGQLQQAGYWTAWVGKNHVPVGRSGYQSNYLENFFDYWYGNHNHSGFYPAELSGDAGRQYAMASQQTQPEVFAQGAMNALNQRDHNRPFCLCVTFNAPHESATGTMRMQSTDDELYRTAYRDAMHEFPIPKSYRPWKQSYAKLPLDVYNGVQLPGYDYVKIPHFLRETMTRQAQLITGIDRFIGELRLRLKKDGLTENTIIIYSSDHGVLFGEHGLGGKALLYDPALRVPLVIYDPRMVGGVSNNELVAVPDIAPTILNLCGLDSDESMQGDSLVPLMQAGSSQQVWSRKQLFIENLFDQQNYPRCEGLVSKEWKYIRYFSRKELADQQQVRLRNTGDDYHGSRLSLHEPVYEELFDRQNDPDEKENVLNTRRDDKLLMQVREECSALAAQLAGDDRPDFRVLK